MGKTLWIINPFEPLPRPDALRGRYGDLLRFLGEHFERVVWWTSDFDHWTKKKRPEPLPDEKTDYRLIPVRPYHRNASLRRLRSHRDFAEGIARQVEGLLTEDPDAVPACVLVSLPPLGIVSRLKQIPMLKSVKVVLDVRDLWPDAFAQFLPLPSALRESVGRGLFASLRALARRDARAADALSAVSQTYLTWAKRLRGTDCPSSVFYLGAALSAAISDKPNETLPPRPFSVAYSGSLSANYDLDTLLKAVESLCRNGLEVQLQIAGRGPGEAALKAQVESLGMNKTVTFHGHLDAPGLWSFLKSAHLGVNAIRPGSLISMPNKIGDYLYAGLPVVNSVPGELANLLARHDCGCPYVAGDAESLAKVIREYVEDANLWQRHRGNALSLGRSEFFRPLILARFAEFLTRT